MPIRAKLVASQILLLVLVLALWEALGGGFGLHVAFLSPLFFSRPSLIFTDLAVYARSGLLFRDISITIVEAAAGLVLGILSGVVFGMLLGRFRTAHDILDPYLVALNSLPRPALAPLLIVWFGLGVMSKIFLAWSLVFFIMLYNTIYGIKNIDTDLVTAVKVMGASPRQITRMVVLPSVLTWIFAAFPASVSFALIGAVVGEFVGSTAGLGYRINIAAGLLETDRVYAILMVLMLLGTAAVYVAKKIESRVLQWRKPL